MEFSIYSDYAGLPLNAAPAADRELVSPEIRLVKALNIARLYLHNAKQACDALLKGRLKAFDAIVGENACQKRALMAITGYQELNEEALAIRNAVEDALKKESKFRSKGASFNLKAPLTETIAALGLDLKVSKAMNNLMRAHLLTVGKFFSMSRTGEESSGISVADVRQKLSKDCDLDTVHASGMTMANLLSGVLSLVGTGGQALPELFLGLVVISGLISVVLSTLWGKAFLESRKVELA